jgi:hypothetical protein
MNLYRCVIMYISICIHIYMYINSCSCTYVYDDVYVHVYKYIRICLYIHMYMYMCICTYHHYDDMHPEQYPILNMMRIISKKKCIEYILYSHGKRNFAKN